jgi:pyridoxal phosphate enzyme (YggS family)
MELVEVNSSYLDIRNKIETAAKSSGRNPDEICLIAVSKRQTVEAIHSLYQLGHRHFGENYVQELLEKAKALQDLGCHDIQWHFIGNLQSNKVKQLLPAVHCIHSVDSLRLAEKIAKHFSELKNGNVTQPLPLFIQVNIDSEDTKSGVLPTEARILAQGISQIPELQLMGLMAIPSTLSPESSFQALRSLEEQCRPFTHGYLSMGMSGDFETAIASGATHIRIGTALFGARTAS